MRDRLFFIDAGAVLLCCVLLALIFFSENAVTVLLLVVIGESILLVASRKVLCAAELLLPMLALAIPNAVIFIPAVLFSAAANRHRLPAAAAVIPLVCRLVWDVMDTGLLCAAALALLAAMLGVRSGEVSRRRSELIRTRDSGTEIVLTLQQKNSELIRKQDNEVNIATLKERNRIAREIHDNVGHLLSRALLQSGALLAVTDSEQMPLQYAQTAALKETLSSAMNSIRESVHGLRDDSIDLHHAVGEAVEAVKSRFRIITDLDFSEKMPPNIKLCMIAVVKEALSNAVKHSSGDTIHIVIREHPALYQLCVTDNGKAAQIRANTGMGLNNMRERTEALGGIFRADTSDGFRIFISIRRQTEDKPHEDHRS